MVDYIKGLHEGWLVLGAFRKSPRRRRGRRRVSFHDGWPHRTDEIFQILDQTPLNP